MSDRDEYRLKFREVFVICDETKIPDLTVSRFDLLQRTHPTSPKPTRHRGKQKAKRK